MSRNGTATNYKTARVAKCAYFTKKIEICTKKIRKIYQKFKISNFEIPLKVQFSTFFSFFLLQYDPNIIFFQLKKSE